MKIINASYEILTLVNHDEILKKLELIGRVCYKSEDQISDNSASDFIKRIIKSGHESVIEHFSISVKFICDRGVSHEIVRHRIASYSQESTRYCNYVKINLTIKLRLSDLVFGMKARKIMRFGKKLFKRQKRIILN